MYTKPTTEHPSVKGRAHFRVFFTETIGDCLCDRLQQHQHLSSNTSTSQRISELFVEILGYARVVNCGLPIQLTERYCATVKVPQGDDASPAAQSQSSERVGQNDEETDTCVAGARTAAGDASQPLTTTSETTCAALQDMEAMLTDNAPSSNTNIASGSGDNKPKEREEARCEVETNAKKPRPAWVRCATWEPCAIGALPGYPY